MNILLIILYSTGNLSKGDLIGKNPFSLMISLFSHLLEQVEKHDILIGKLAAKNKNIKLNLYYTPTSLTENSLIFSKRLMVKWWEQGYNYAKLKHESEDENNEGND